MKDEQNTQHEEGISQAENMDASEPSETIYEPHSDQTINNPLKRFLDLPTIQSLNQAVYTLKDSLRVIKELAIPVEDLALQIDQLGVNDSDLNLGLRKEDIVLASCLKSYYQRDELWAIDYSLEFDSESAKGIMGQLRGKFENEFTEEKVEGVLESEEQSISDSDDEDGDEEFFPACSSPIHSSAESETNEEFNTSSYLPFPQIKDPLIRAKVFTHRSATPKYKQSSKFQAINSNYERSEFVGDYYLNFFMSCIVTEEFPSESPGELTAIRVKLVNNRRLSRWCIQYGLHEQLRIVNVTRGYNSRQKIFGDLFEAYIGGLIEDSPVENYTAVYYWLKELVLPILHEYKQKKQRIQEQISYNELNKPCLNETELNENAKNELYQQIGYASLGLRYIKKRQIEVNLVQVNLATATGEVISWGVGKNMHEAGIRAAMWALADRELINKWASKRALLDREDSVQSSDPYKTLLKGTKRNSGRYRAKSNITTRDRGYQAMKRRIRGR
ncbi:hypothetical protein WICPIJ_008535 [Wickerhamomyces pijperi]|uniref:RNase III domain-containing protein n=1 Tax=Wickerhamomyces pijperi TaxID=599730 RepID=A0A9P8PX41_WICPI|nr:hypothetical protein WICPIJ_008535 [Wickerhamomyces pijperi]